MVPDHRQAALLSLKKSTLETIKSHVEYLLPYLKMDERRELLEELTISHSSFAVDIYELLVSLRVCGKDAEMLVRTIQQVAARVREEPHSLPVVLKYIELAKESKHNLQLNFFVCNQLIQ
jgi:thymidine kinase